MASRMMTLPICARLTIRSTITSQTSRFTTSAARSARGVARTQPAPSIGVKPTSIWQKLKAPVGDNAYGIGRGAVAAGAAVGIGALCVYTTGLSGTTDGIREKSMLWPQHVKDRVKSTYMYFGGSLLISAGSAVAVFRTPALLRLAASNSWVGILGSLALMIGTGVVCRSIPYEEGFGTKQMAWMVHSGVIGACIAPICFVGGPVVLRAAWYTAGLVGGLSAIAVCAPSDKFLKMQGPLAMGLGVVFMSSIAGAFLPPTTVIGAGIHSVVMYGGLLLFSGLLMYDTQKIMHNAERHPQYSVEKFDPINSSISIYLDTINLFIRIAMMLAGGGSKKK